MKPTLGVLVPIPIVDAYLVSSTVLENEHEVWMPGTTYPVAARCILDHRIYECMRAGNLGHDPRLDISRAAPAPWWTDLAPTNKWAAFDTEVSTETVADKSMTMTLRPGAANAVFLAGIDAESLSITVTDVAGGSVIYEHVDRLEASAPADYWEYYYDRFKPARDFLVTGLVPYQSAEMTITLSRTSGQVKCGVLAVGDLRPLGATQYGATAEPKSYSYVKTDEFGKTKIKRRKGARDMSASALVPLVDANAVIDVLMETMDVPCVWVGMNLPEYRGLRVFGLGTGKLAYANATQTQLTLTVEGLI